MATSEECNRAWKDGYISGFQSISGTIPSVPARPGSHPPGVDPLAFYYQKGYEAGVTKATG